MYKVLTRKQLDDLDMPRSHLAEAVDCCLYRARRGWFVVLSACEKPHHAVLEQFSTEQGITFPRFHGDIRDDAERLRLQIACRRDSLLRGDVFSHISAGLIHGLDPTIIGAERVEVSRRAPTRSYPGLYVYSRAVPADEVALRNSYPVTSLRRTLADIALDHSLEVSVPLISQALRDHGVTREEIRRLLMNGSRGVRRARLALEISSELFEAASEALCAVRFHEHGITGMVPQVDVRTAAGAFIARNDFQHETLPVVVEVHGVGKYYLHPDGPDAAAKANHQRNMNLLNAGYRVFNLTFGDLFRPKMFAEIKRCLDGMQQQQQRRH